MSTSNVQDLQERNNQLLNNISELQKQEQNLYDQLNDTTLSPEQKQSIINQINELSQIRFNLYSSMKDILSSYQQGATNTQNTLSQQVTAINIIEEQLNKNKLEINALDAQKQNKLKLVEINTYYGKRYNTYKHLMKTIVLFCIPIVVLTYIYNTDLLPGRLYAFIVGLIIMFAMVVIGYQLIDISNRDNMNWDEYNWYFNKSTAPIDSSTGHEKDPWVNPTITCIGAECCTNGSVFDSSLNKCVSDGTCSNPKDAPLTETMISGVLGKYGFTLVRPVATIQENIKPANSVKNLYEEL